MKSSEALRHTVAILVLPGVVTLLVPFLILDQPGRLTIDLSQLSLGSVLRITLGFSSIGLGLFLMYQTIRLFGVVGSGTLAPWDPPQRLVVRGIYQHVRNPMITGVFCVLLGEAFVFGSRPLLQWFLFFVLINFIYIPIWEEPRLAHRFGNDYLEYKRNVPRWIPRLRPWELVKGER